MNKVIWALMFVAVLLAPSAAGEDPLKIVATTTVLGDLASQVGGDQVEVTSIVSAGVCPGHWDLKPSQLQDITKADVIIQHGMEAWLTNLVSDDQRLVKLPGPWNTPQMAVEKVQKIDEVLNEVDPVNADLYDQRTQRFVEEIEYIKDDLAQRAVEKNTADIEVLCMEWQSGFVSWMGFNLTQTYGSEETLSVKDVNDLINIGKEKNVALVIANLQSGVDLGVQMAKEIGAEYVILTNFPGAVEETETLQDMMRYNGEQLLNAI